MNPEEMLAEIRKMLAETDRPDSLEIGTPGKGGAVKVYFDARKSAEAWVIVSAAIELHHRARQAFEGGGGT